MLTDTYIKEPEARRKGQKIRGWRRPVSLYSDQRQQAVAHGYRFNKKSKLLSFGEYPTVTLKKAREKRDEAKKLLADGIDPAQHKKAARAAREAEEANSFKKYCAGMAGNADSPHFAGRKGPSAALSGAAYFSSYRFHADNPD